MTPMHRRLALVRRPSPSLANGIVTHIERAGAVDAGLAHRQWGEYVAVLERRGWEVVEAPPADDCPDGVFIEDQVVVHGDVAVLCRSGAPDRRAEQAGLRETLEGLGYRTVEITEPPRRSTEATCSSMAPGLGRSGRSTNAEGVAQLAAAFGRTGSRWCRCRDEGAAPEAAVPPCRTAPSSATGRSSTTRRVWPESSPCQRNPAPTSCCWAGLPCSCRGRARAPRLLRARPRRRPWSTSPSSRSSRAASPACRCASGADRRRTAFW